MARIFYVAANGDDQNDGTDVSPFRTISKAAEVAMPGDRVIVREGVYREWVKPARGGDNDIHRIEYEAAKGETVVIKGSEPIDNWERLEGDVWKAKVANEIFGSFNPYKEELFGDWFLYPNPNEWRLHLGDVYLNGKSLYEARTLAEVKNPTRRETGFNPPWTKHPEPLLHPEDSVYQWYAEVDADYTTIYANFQGADPNRELVEINVRKCCFYPQKTGCNYITVRGFEMAHAACPWAPPTADQPGLLGVNWSKGWIIERNRIHDAKCSGISIGKEASTGHNLCSLTHRKPGYQYQMEAVFLALRQGWSKENIGSHIIRYNEIYDCGQNGIVGHMGCVFSEIYENHIYNIAVKHEFFGYEIAGIKLHAAIDVQIKKNRINNCTLGVWLDWQAQGARISKNLFYDNDRDLMLEVTHGPHIVDNNIFASDYMLDNIAQGGAFVHNLCCGTMRREPVPDRATPYHFQHTTEPAGTTFVYGGDDRWYNNIFVGGSPVYTEQSTSGTADYDGSPPSYEAYIQEIISRGVGDAEMFSHVKSPVYIDNNVYVNGAESYDKEENAFISSADLEVRIVTEGKKVFLELSAEEGIFKLPDKPLDSTSLGMTRISECAFDDPEGRLLSFNSDYNDQLRSSSPVPGPFEELEAGFNRILVWE